VCNYINRHQTRSDEQHLQSKRESTFFKRFVCESALSEGEAGDSVDAIGVVSSEGEAGDSVDAIGVVLSEGEAGDSVGVGPASESSENFGKCAIFLLLFW